MQWRKVSAELSALLASALVGFDCQKKQMFGCPAYFVGGNMFAGVHQESLMLRLSESDRTEILAAHPDVAVFEPMPGRPMREYVELPESIYGREDLLRGWLSRAFIFAAGLPPKEPKRKKGR